MTNINEEYIYLNKHWFLNDILGNLYISPSFILLVTTSEMTQNIQDTQETDRTPLWPEEQNWAN